MKRLNKGKMTKIILTFTFVIYVSFVFVKQQCTLNSYKNEKAYISSKINEQNEYKNTLLATKENVNSKEYIEELARKKLNMYLPNERVYEDVGN